MSWQAQLNQIRDRIPLDGGAGGELEMLGWHYDAHLVNNLPHRHTFYEICQVGGYGGGIYTVNGVAHPIGPGDLFIARPGVLHRIMNTRQPLMELRWLNFIWHPPAEGVVGEVARVFRSLAESNIWVVSDADDRIGAIWRALLALADGPTHLGFSSLAANLIAGLVIAIAQSGSGPLLPAPASPHQAYDPGERQIETAIRYVADNLAGDLTVAEIAGQLCLSPRQCTRLFERCLATSPAAFAAEQRLAQAARLLRYSSRPVKEIAAEVGMPDVPHFTRRFRARFGSPPAIFRRDPNASAPVDAIFSLNSMS